MDADDERARSRDERDDPRDDQRDDPLDDPLDEPGEDDAERFRERISSRSPDAVADAVNALLDNPILNQALKAAFGARDVATDVQNQTLHGLNIATANDLDRLTRRLRSISNRIEAIEDGLDRLEREVVEARRNPAPRAAPATVEDERDEEKALKEQGKLVDDEWLSQERLGLSE